MHQLFCIGNSCAVCSADGLVPETDTEDRIPGAELADHFDTYAGVLGVTGAWRENYRLWIESFDLIDGHRIIPDDADIVVD